MRNLMLFFCVLAMPCVSSAQSNQSSWGNLKTLRPGQKIEIVETNLKKDTGAFAAVSDDAIRINESTGEQSIPRASVMRVTLRQNKHRLRNTLTGAAVGAGTGAVIGAASYKTAKPCPPGAGIGCISGNILSRGAVTGIGATLGFVGGAAVGAVIPSHPTIYRASAH